MEVVIEKSLIKEALKELMQEEPLLFKQIIFDALSETSKKDEEFEALINKNFARFEATFKALA